MEASISSASKLLRSWLSCVIGELSPRSRKHLQLAVSCVLVHRNQYFESILRLGIR